MTDLITERVGRVLVATINRAAQGNSIGGTLMADLLAASQEVENDDALGALLLTSTGKIWSSGGDPGELGDGFGPGADASRLVLRDGLGGKNGLPELSDQALAFDELGIGAWLLQYRRCQKPLIAAVGGVAVGGGFALALAHDLRIAGDGARFRPAFNALGVGPELGTSWTLSRLIGTGRATEAILSDRWIDAQQSLQLGIVSELVAGDKLYEHALAVAQDIASRPAPAVRAAMRVLREPAASLGAALRRETQLRRALDRVP